MIGIYLNYHDYYHDNKILNSSTSSSTSSSSVRTSQNITDSDNCDDLKSMKSRLIVSLFDDYSVTDVEALHVSDIDWWARSTIFNFVFTAYYFSVRLKICANIDNRMKHSEKFDSSNSECGREKEDRGRDKEDREWERETEGEREIDRERGREIKKKR